MLGAKEINNYPSIKTVIPSEMDMAEKCMDKDRDDQYLAGPYGVTRPIEKTKNNISEKKSGLIVRLNESSVDGFNNSNRHPADYSEFDNKLISREKKYASDEFQPNQDPGPQDKDITLEEVILLQTQHHILP